jgi:glutathione S-transferase
MTARLITIGVSHYCEVARWALHYTRTAHREERHLQGFHRLALLRVNAQTTPALILPDRNLLQTYDIIEFAHESALASGRPGLLETSHEQSLTRQLLENLGPPVRLFVYHHALQIPRAELSPMNNRGAPLWQRMAFPLLYGRVSQLIRKHYAIDDVSAAEAAHACQSTLERVAGLLQDGRRYLCGDRLSAADLAFAGLVSPLAGPPEHPLQPPPLQAWSSPLREALERFDAHPALQFARRLYREHRWQVS